MDKEKAMRIAQLKTQIENLQKELAELQGGEMPMPNESMPPMGATSLPKEVM